jgi:hypothetical protein
MKGKKKVGPIFRIKKKKASKDGSSTIFFNLQKKRGKGKKEGMGLGEEGVGDAICPKKRESFV